MNWREGTLAVVALAAMSLATLGYGAASSNGVTHIELSRIDGSQARALVGEALDSSAPDWSSVP